MRSDLHVTIPPGGDDKSPDTLHELSRDKLRATLGNAIDHARMSQRFVAVLIVTLVRSDKFEALFGIPTADVMRRALKRLPAVLRAADRYVQLSDEKICIVLPNLKSIAQAWLAVSKFQHTLEAPFSFENSMVAVRPVTGIAYYPDHAADAEELVVNADIAQNIAMTRDLAQHVFQKDDRRDSEIYSGLEAMLRDALRANLLEMQYQPLINFKTGRCEAVEALLRWNTPDRGYIEPGAIIRVAEANGLVGALTGWVLNTALRNQEEWKRAGHHLGVSVNLSTISLTDGDLPDVVMQTLGTWQTAPEELTLEITESSTISNMEMSLGILERLKQIGVKLSVDDFGTGYSSLSYVKRFPLDELKIDKTFVQNMRQSKGDQQIVRSVIDLAHNFELSVVAEGIEDEATYKDLKKYGCDIAQGFYISSSMQADALQAWLKTRRQG
jgi:EAL domain-containing protein (putative c-di-GMP-specific phosphodiesterase class I)/GGDEF domain-containing protein